MAFRPLALSAGSAAKRTKSICRCPDRRKDRAASTDGSSPATDSASLASASESPWRKKRFLETKSTPPHNILTTSQNSSIFEYNFIQPLISPFVFTHLCNHESNHKARPKTGIPFHFEAVKAGYDNDLGVNAMPGRLLRDTAILLILFGMIALAHHRWVWGSVTRSPYELAL